MKSFSAGSKTDNRKQRYQKSGVIFERNRQRKMQDAEKQKTLL